MIKNGSAPDVTGRGQLRVRTVVGQILLAGEEAHVTAGAAASRGRAASRSAWDTAPRARRGPSATVAGPSTRTVNFAFEPRQRPQMRRQHDPDHHSVWTSTESTAGRSRTIGAHVSPASADAYTWPPVVPK